MGQRQYQKIEQIRAYYDENNKEVSDYDQILPITTFDAVHETFEDDSPTLTYVINLIKLRLDELTLGKQNTIQAGTSGNVAIFTGQDGVLGEIEKIDQITTDPATASPNKLVTEKAITDFHENVLKPEIADAAGLAGRVTTLEGNQTIIQTDVSNLTSKMTAAEANISNLNTKTTQTDENVTNLRTEYDETKATVSNWQNGILNPDGGSGSFKELKDKVAVLDSESAKTSDFGDGKYVKSISVTEIGEDEISISHEIESISGGASDVISTVITSSDNSIKIDLTTVGSVNTIDLVSDISRDEFNTKLDKNSPITAATATKVMYDTKGLIIGNVPLTSNDIPNIGIQQVTDLPVVLDGKTDDSDFNALSNVVGTKADKTTVDALNTKVDTKVTANESIIAGTSTKVTYDDKGLVTSGTGLSPSDIPNISMSQVNDLPVVLDGKTDDSDFNALNTKVDTKADQTALDTLNTKTDTKVTANAAIVANTATKVTYDAKGLVTAGTGLSASDIPNIAISQVTDLQNMLDSKTDDTDFDTLSNVVSTKANQSTVDILDAKVDTKVTANAPVEGKVATKVTYDAKGLVTVGTNLSPSDIPNIEIAQVNDLQSKLSSKTNVTDFQNLSDVVSTKADKSTVEDLTLIVEGKANSSALTELTNAVANKADISQINALDAKVNTKITANPAIVPGTATKVAYDSKGLVVSTSPLVSSDIPDIAISQVAGLEFALNDKATTAQIDALQQDIEGMISQSELDALTNIVNTKLEKNVPIIASTGLKLTYDSKGLIVGKVPVNQSDIPDLAISKVIDLQTELDEKVSTSNFAELEGIVSGKSDKTTVDALTAVVDNKVTANTPIVGKSATKVVYDAKGLITGSSALTTADLPADFRDKVTNIEVKTDSLATKESLNNLSDVVNLKVPSNDPIIAGTKTKITYDAKGLVTDGTNLTADDIPNVAISKVTDLQNALDNKTNVSEFNSLNTKVDTKADQTALDTLNTKTDTKVTANESIVAGVATKVTYDENGLVTSGTQLVSSDIPNINISQVVGLQDTLDDKTNVTDFQDLSDEVSLKANQSTVGALAAVVDTKVIANAAIVAGTSTKVTYDEKGLVTSGANLEAVDIPNIDMAQINVLPETISTMQNDIDTRVIANEIIEGKTAAKVTYDAKGLITGSEVLVKTDLPELAVNDIVGLQSALGSKTPFTEFDALSGVVSTKADKTTVEDLEALTNTKVTANAAIVANTATKVTYDDKGLVTGGTNLTEVDIPTLSQTKVDGLIEVLESKANDDEFHTLATSVNNNTAAISIINSDIAEFNIEIQTKVTKNPDIIPGSYTKVLVDTKGLVTAGSQLSAADIPDIDIDQVTGLPTALNSKVDNSVIPGLQTAINNRVIVNPAITPGTATKVTFDEKGLVTQATYLSPSDIPMISIEQVNGLDGALTNLDVSVQLTDLQSQIDTKVEKNAPIIANTASKVSYDSKGLITGNSELTTGDLPIDFRDRVANIEEELPTLASKESLDNLSATVATKVIANVPITPGTSAKVKYDAKGLIIGVESLIKTDLPELGVDDIVGLPAALLEKATVEDLMTVSQTMSTKAPQSAVDIINNQLTTVNSTLVRIDGDLITTNNRISDNDFDITHIEDDLTAVTTRVGNTEDTLSQTNLNLANVKNDLYGTDAVGNYLKSRFVAGGNISITEKLDSDDVTYQLQIDAIIPDLPIDKIINLQSSLNTKADKTTVNSLSDIVISHTDSIDDINSTLLTKANSSDVTTLTDVVNTKLEKNNPIVANTATKITYDAKGLVTGGEALVKADLPELAVVDIVGLSDSLNEKSDLTFVQLLASDLQNTDDKLDTTNMVLNQVGANTSSVMSDLYGSEDNNHSCDYLKNRLVAGDHIAINESVSGDVEQITVLTINADVSDRVVVNPAITPGTATKVTYDEKGLVTGSTTLVENDIPTLSQSKISGLLTTITNKADKSAVETLSTRVDTKIDKNADIIPGSAVKVAYDKKGLITNSLPLTEEDIPSLSQAKIDGLSTSLVSKANQSTVDALDAKVNTKITANESIIAGTATKVTYDDKGLVTSGTVLSEEDIPTLSQAKVDGLADALTNKADVTTVDILDARVDTKVEKNADIVPGTATKVTYDSKGLVTGNVPLTPNDLPHIEVTHVNGLQAILDAKMNKTDISLSVNTAGNLVITWDDGE